ncbi:MAG TPA: NIPSNAP family protein [Bacteroidota bacterium]|nr:NIPSNAP family protein [Bacteroidota bacterium]
MILIRDVFQVKFGRMKEAKALAKQDIDFQKRSGVSQSRFLTDLTGPYYTLIMETTYDNLATYEKTLKETLTSKEFKKWYKKFMPLVESGRREMFTIVE